MRGKVAFEQGWDKGYEAASEVYREAVSEIFGEEGAHQLWLWGATCSCTDDDCLAPRHITA